VILNAGGGHPGNDPAHAAVRRRIAPCDGKIAIDGRLENTQLMHARARVAGRRTLASGAVASQNACQLKSPGVTAMQSPLPVHLLTFLLIFSPAVTSAIDGEPWVPFHLPW